MNNNTLQNQESKEKYCIYMHTCIITGKSYIGKTTFGIEHRWNTHLTLSRSESPNHLHRAIRKHGDNTWVHSILYVSFEKDDTHLYEVEKQLIYDWDTFKNGYNMIVGGTGVGSGEDSPNWGKKHKPESIEKMRISQTGKRHTPESIKKISEARKGTKMSKELREKLSEIRKGHKWNLGRKDTPEQCLEKRDRMRVAKKQNNNKSGICGVNWHSRQQRWRAYLKTDGKSIHLGSFMLKNDAIIARLIGELEHWGQIIIYDY